MNENRPGGELCPCFAWAVGGSGWFTGRPHTATVRTSLWFSTHSKCEKTHVQGEYTWDFQ